MLLPLLHRGVDRLAMWSEDRIERAPQAYRTAPSGPLSCFGPLPALPDPPPGPGRWSAPSPVAIGPGDDRMVVHWLAVAAPPRRGTAVLVPPWKTDSLRLVRGYVSLLRRAGYDVWLLVPPHHLERTAAAARSGEGFVSLDLARMRAVFEQLVVEIRVASALAATRGQVGVIGLSLGALATALAAAAPEPIDFAALVAPPADLASVLLETPIGMRYRRLAERAGTDLPAETDLRRLLAPLDPARLRPTARRVFVATGRHDVIALSRGATGLAAAWGVEPRVYPRGHLTLLFACRALRRDLAGFLRGAARDSPSP